MAKLALVVVSLAALLGTTQIYAQTQPGAQTLDCKGELAKAEPMVNSMKDETQKAAMMKEITQAKAMLAVNDEKGCMTHLQVVRDRMSTNRPDDR